MAKRIYSVDSIFGGSDFYDESEPPKMLSTRISMESTEKQRAQFPVPSAEKTFMGRMAISVPASIPHSEARTLLAPMEVMALPLIP